MDNAITGIQVFLVIGFGVGGLAQVIVPYTRYPKLPFQDWANDFRPWHIKLIGFLKMCAAVTIFISLFLNSPIVLTPLAAVGLALVMAGAMATHLRRAEYLNMVGNLMWLGLALVVAYDTLVEIAV